MSMTLDEFYQRDYHIEQKLYYVLSLSESKCDQVLGRWLRDSELGAEIILLAKSVLEENG